MQDQCQGEKYVYFKGIGDDRMKTGLPDKDLILETSVEKTDTDIY